MHISSSAHRGQQTGCLQRSIAAAHVLTRSCLLAPPASRQPSSRVSSRPTPNSSSTSSSSHTASHTLELHSPPGLLHHHQMASHGAVDEVQQLQHSVHDLAALVEQQQHSLVQQQATIQQLQATVQQLTQQHHDQQQRQQLSGSSQGSWWDPSIRPFDAQRAAYGDRRLLGLFDAQFHSTSRGAIPADVRVLPDRIILVRHAQSEGNVDCDAYTYIPDPQVPLTSLGSRQAQDAGQAIRRTMEAAKGTNYQLFFYTSPYKRSIQTCMGIRDAFASSQVAGVQEEVQLREQDFGNFQDAEGKQREKAERLRYGRFFYRFPNGESGADVYDRITVFTDHLIRDINAGRFANNTSLVLVTHGLALRIFLMRWFHWSVDQFMSVYNPPNAVPLVLEKAGPNAGDCTWMHTKSFYRLCPNSMAVLKGCTPDMCATHSLP
ncbi:histidine phosphatase superfamily, partial [Scenedesmus sp. NREL 46B-D3]